MRVPSSARSLARSSRRALCDKIPAWAIPTQSSWVALPEPDSDLKWTNLSSRSAQGTPSTRAHGWINCCTHDAKSRVCTRISWNCRWMSTPGRTCSVLARQAWRTFRNVAIFLGYSLMVSTGAFPSEDMDESGETFIRNLGLVLYAGALLSSSLKRTSQRSEAIVQVK
jgi:hypothetical protein